MPAAGCDKLRSRDGEGAATGKEGAGGSQLAVLDHAGDDRLRRALVTGLVEQGARLLADLRLASADHMAESMMADRILGFVERSTLFHKQAYIDTYITMSPRPKTNWDSSSQLQCFGIGSK